MALKYFAETKTIRNVLYRIEIDDTDFSGSATEFNVGGDGFRLDYSSQNSGKYNPVVGSKLSFRMKVTGSTLEAFISDLTNAPEGRFTVKILRNAAFYWAGFVLTDISAIQDHSFPYDFTVSAVDGLGRLKNIDYESGTSPIHVATVLTHILNILNKDVLAAKYWSTSDIFLRTSVDWWHTTHSTPSTAKDPVALTRFSGYCFSEQQKDGTWKHSNCFQVLEHIARAWGARIYFSAGSYRFEQVNYRTNNTFNERRYSRTGTAISQASINYNRSLSQTNAGARLDGASYEFYAPLKQVRVNYDHKTAKNHLEWSGWRWGYNRSNETQILTGVGLDSSSFFKISGKVRLNLAGASAQPFHYRVLMTLNVGGNYLRRNVSFPSGQNVLNYENPVWQATGDVTISTGLIYSTSFSGVVDFSIWTPAVGTTGQVEVDFSVAGAQKANGSTVTLSTAEWLIEDLVMVVSNSNDDSNLESAREYVLDNATTGNSETVEIETKFGDALKPWTTGKLEVSANGSTWSEAVGGWAFDGAGSFPFGWVLAKEIMAGQNAPVRRMLGAIRGDDFYFHSLISDTALFNWLFLAGTYTAKYEEWSGEWFGDYYGSVSNDPQVIIDFERTVPGTKNETSLPAKTVQADPFMAVFDVINSAKVGAILPAGTTTSVPVASPLQASVFVAGQKIRVVYPTTNQTAQLTVSATNAAGATAIAVTGTLPADFPNESYIISDNNANNQSGGSGAIPAGNFYTTDGTLSGARTVTQNTNAVTWRADGSATLGQEMHKLRGNVESTGTAVTSSVFLSFYSKTNALLGWVSGTNSAGNKTVDLNTFSGWILQLLGDAGVKLFASASSLFEFKTDGSFVLPSKTSDPALPVNGAMWYRDNLSNAPFKVRRGSNVEEIMTAPQDTRGNTDFGSPITVTSTTYTAGGYALTVVLNANTNAITVTLGASLREGYDYWFDCDNNSTNNVVFNADTANGFVLKIAGNTTLTPTTFTAASGGAYIVRRVGGVIFLK